MVLGRAEVAYSAFSTEDQPESVDGGVVGVGVVAARVLAANRSQVRFIFLGLDIQIQRWEGFSYILNSVGTDMQPCISGFTN